MVVYFGADHRGFEMKNTLIGFVKSKGYEVVDLGAGEYNESDDYPDFAAKVGQKVSLEYENARGIVLCGSGVGVSVVANKFHRVRSALVFNPDQAYDSRNDDNANVLALPAEYLSLDQAKRIVFTWLETPFSGEGRHDRRVSKIYSIEKQVCNQER